MSIEFCIACFHIMHVQSMLYVFYPPITNQDTDTDDGVESDARPGSRRRVEGKGKGKGKESSRGASATSPDAEAVLRRGSSLEEVRAAAAAAAAVAAARPR